MEADPTRKTITETIPPPRRRRRYVIGGVVLLVLGCLVLFGVPWLRHYWGTVSTDDAYVAGHVTLVSTRTTGVVDRVFVEDNDFVEAGTLLVELDGEPYRLAVEEKRAALARAKMNIDQQQAGLKVAQADLEQARNQVHSQIAGLRAGWFLVKTVQDLVRYQVAALHSDLATLRLQQANLTLAQKELDRVQQLNSAGQAASKEELEQRQAALVAAREQVNAAEQKVQQDRSILGLKPDRDHPDQVPDNLDQNFAGVQYALAGGQQTLAQLGVVFHKMGMSSSDMLDHLMAMDSEGLINQVPAVQAALARVSQAQAALGGAAYNPAKPYENPTVVQAQKELEEAELQLRYTQIKAPIAGYVNQRSINPGSHVQPGQALLAVRPLQDVWIEANFKETQLEDLRIGQPVALRVDAYPGRVFHGRVAGFSSGTGAALSLLPPENATGNFVKVVQRLPVRIDLTEPNPADTPLWVGLSVVPEVNIRAEPTGADAGRRLRGAGGELSRR
ncbi:MAG: HlyD family secretion protein [Planctomycetes bacterium]|nr:HlyD family secretion protein [Planctomycetota bacterium]